MTDEELATARALPDGDRRLEAGAFLHAVRPIATDLASMLFFYLVLLLTGDVRAGTVLGIALGVLQIAVRVLRRRAIPPIMAASALLLIGLGAMTLWLNDARFMLVKASLIYLVIGGAMLKRGWMTSYLPPIVAGRVPPALVSAFGLAWAALMLGTGVLNLGLTFTVSPRTVATVIAPWAIGSKLVLFGVQYMMFRRAVRRHIRTSADLYPQLAR